MTLIMLAVAKLSMSCSVLLLLLYLQKLIEKVPVKEDTYTVPYFLCYLYHLVSSAHTVLFHFIAVTNRKAKIRRGNVEYEDACKTRGDESE